MVSSIPKMDICHLPSESGKEHWEKGVSPLISPHSARLPPDRLGRKHPLLIGSSAFVQRFAPFQTLLKAVLPFAKLLCTVFHWRLFLSLGRSVDYPRLT